MANEIDFKKLEKEIENTTKQTKNFNKELNSTTKILSSSKDNFFTYLASGMKEAESSISVVDTLAGKLNDTVSGTATAIGSIGSLFSNASKESTISITDITSTISSGFGGAISAISGTIDLAIMLGSAFNQMYQAALDKKIDEHFGSVNLSLQQIESLADDITSNSWTMKIDTVITAQEQLNTLRSSIQTNIDT